MSDPASRAPATVEALPEIELERARLGFGIHFAAYVIVNAFLVFLNVAYAPSVWWFVFPLAGWSIGIVAHYVGVFRIAPLKLRENRLRRELGGEAHRAP